MTTTGETMSDEERGPFTACRTCGMDFGRSYDKPIRCDSCCTAETLSKQQQAEVEKLQAKLKELVAERATPAEPPLPSIPQAIAAIVAELRRDEGYRIGWVANIAMAFKDEYARRLPGASDELRWRIHEIANKAAENFLDVLCMPASVTPAAPQRADVGDEELAMAIINAGAPVVGDTPITRFEDDEQRQVCMAILAKARRESCPVHAEAGGLPKVERLKVGDDVVFQGKLAKVDRLEGCDGESIGFWAADHWCAWLNEGITWRRVQPSTTCPVRVEAGGLPEIGEIVETIDREEWVPHAVERHMECQATVCGPMEPCFLVCGRNGMFIASEEGQWWRRVQPSAKCPTCGYPKEPTGSEQTHRLCDCASGETVK